MKARVPFFREKLKLVEPMSGSFLKALWTEYLCTLFFLYLAVGSIVFGCSSTEVSGGTSGSTGQSGGTTATPQDCLLDNSRVVSIAMSFGFTVFVLVYVAAAFSGGHLNPAISLAFLLAKKISLQRFVCYVISQLAGAMTGSALVYATDKAGFKAAKGGCNRLLAGLPLGAGWLLESLLTFLLVFVVFTATDQARAQSTAHLPILAPAGIGFAVFVCHLAAVALDGCSINPARSFGPAVVYGDWTHHWIFWVGPFTGAIVAFLVYEFTFRPSQEPIKSVDYKYEDGKTVQSTRLPGYSGVSGLDAEQDAEDEKREAADLEAGMAKKTKHSPARRRDTAEEFSTIYEDVHHAGATLPGNWTGDRRTLYCPAI
ncbi:hypothetical protein WJX79_000263 [Trebouxia sp. C0005]